MTKVRLEYTGQVVRLFLARPEVRNAFDPELIAELRTTAESIAADPQIRVVVLSGEGTHFCAGADLSVMRSSIELSEAENLADARRMGCMFEALDRLPQTLIGRIHGAALGGGAGLSAVCDIVVAAEDAVFGFPEVRLGLLPAVIGPYVLAKLGYSQTRMRFVNGARFDAATALRIGFIHEVVPAAELDIAVQRHCEAALACAPGAVAAVKTLLAELSSPQCSVDVEEHRRKRLDFTTAVIARRRCSDEAQAGLQAFLAHEPAPWIS